jgi:hypothetical protein
LKPSEAVWLRKNPIIIGLVSVLVGSTDLREIEAFCAAASHRGSQILRGELLDDDGKGLESKEIKRQWPSLKFTRERYWGIFTSPVLRDELAARDRSLNACTPNGSFESKKLSNYSRLFG